MPFAYQAATCRGAARGTGGGGSYLGGQPSGIVGQQGCYGGAWRRGLNHAAQVEVSNLDSPVTLHNHVG